MGKSTSISLGNHFEDFIKREINSGKYNSVSDVIRTALRLLERENLKENALIKALEAGEKSEMTDDVDADRHLKELHRKNG